MQKYPHILESQSSVNIYHDISKADEFLIYIKICLTPKLSKYVTLIPFTYKAIQGVLIDSYTSRFTTYNFELTWFEKLFH